MTDKTIWGCAETGTYRTTSPSPHVDLSGIAATGFAITQTFAGGLSNTETATITIFKDSANWAVYKNAKYTTGTPNILDLIAATLLDSAGTLSAADAVTALGLSPLDGLARREVLAAARTYYVATTGSDSNDGLAVGTPFATIQKAVDVANGLDARTYQVTVQIADGTYNESVTVRAMNGSLPLIIKGNTSNPASVTVNGTTCFLASGGAVSVIIKDMKLVASSVGLSALYDALIEFTNLVFGTASARHINAQYGGHINNSGSYTVTGSALQHIFIDTGSTYRHGGTCAMSGSPAFSSQTISAAGGAQYIKAAAGSFSGSATGPRYAVSLNAVVNTVGGGGEFFPGSSDGTVATGGQYL